MNDQLVPRRIALPIIRAHVSLHMFDYEAAIKRGPPYVKVPLGPVVYLPPRPCMN